MQSSRLGGGSTADLKWIFVVKVRSAMLVSLSAHDCSSGPQDCGWGDISTWHLSQDEYGMYGVYLGKPSAEQFHTGRLHALAMGLTTKILPPQCVCWIGEFQ
jgi:hypothetical protein